MNDWIKLAIPLIAVAVWILSNLANQQKETRRLPRAAPSPPPRPRDSAAASSKPPENDDKYREEMDRKREKKPSVAKPLPKPRTRRLETAPKPPPLVLRPAPAPLSRNRDKDERNPTATNLYLPIQIPVAAEPAAKVGEPAVPIIKPTPMAIKNMLELLKKRDSLTTAFLLKEVLDLPVSKRPRRRL